MLALPPSWNIGMMAGALAAAIQDHEVPLGLKVIYQDCGAEDGRSLGLGLSQSFHICHVQPTSGPLLLETKIDVHLTKATVNLDFLFYIAEPILPDIRVHITQSYPSRQGLKYNVKATDNTKDLWQDDIFRGYVLGSEKDC